MDLNIYVHMHIYIHDMKVGGDYWRQEVLEKEEEEHGMVAREQI